MKWFMSQALRSSRLRKLKSCVGKEMAFLLLLGTCMWLGGMALTSVTMAGWQMAAFVTQPQWQGPSVVEVYLGWEPCIAMRTKQAFLTQIASLMPTAMNVSFFFLVIIFSMLIILTLKSVSFNMYFVPVLAESMSFQKKKKKNYRYGFTKKKRKNQLKRCLKIILAVKDRQSFQVRVQSGWCFYTEFHTVPTVTPSLWTLHILVPLVYLHHVNEHKNRRNVLLE